MLQTPVDQVDQFTNSLQTGVQLDGNAEFIFQAAFSTNMLSSPVYHNFSATRSLALRERGLRSISSTLGSIALFLAFTVAT